MSRGPGRVERTIEKAFTDDPYRSWSVYDLSVLVYYPPDPTNPLSHLHVPRVTQHQRRSVLRAANKVAQKKGWKRLPGLVWKDTANENSGKHLGRRNIFESNSADARAHWKRVMTRAHRERRGLPPDPTPEELAAEARQRDADAAKRAEHEAKVAKVMAALDTKDQAELMRLRAIVEEAERAIEGAKLDMQAALLRGQGLNNIAARVLQDAGGDLDKALEIVADRMIDEDAA